MFHFRKSLVYVLAICVCLVMVSGKTIGQAAEKPIKIGYLLPLTGRFAPYGFSQRQGVSLAADQINAAGGINGHPVEIVAKDSPFDPKQVVMLMRELAAEKEKILAVIGPMSSGEFEVAAPLANQLKITIITATASKPGIPGKNRPWVFRMQTSDDKQVPFAISGLKKLYPNIKKVAICGNVQDAVHEAMTRTIYPRELKARGYEVVDTITFVSSTKDFSPIVTRIKNSGAEAISFSSMLPNALGMAKELMRQGVKLPVFATAHPWSGPFLDLSKEAGDGWISVALFDFTREDKRLQDFLKELKKRLEADPKAAKPVNVRMEPQAADILFALKHVMEKAGVTAETNLKTARQAIRDGLEKLDFNGITGHLKMNEEGEAWVKNIPVVGDAKTKTWKPIK